MKRRFASGVVDNLPRPATSLIGRSQERSHVVDLVGRDRLVTLVGPAGMGKTRLAIGVALDAMDSVPDGACFVDLSLMAEPNLVVNAVAAALGARERGGEPLLRTVIDHLSGRRLLLILDNCEHLLHACSDLVCHLERECSGLRVLATSREQLGVVGESVWTVPPLAPPTGESVLEVAANDAARLFLARVSGAMVLDEESAATVARICRRLDGIPLAIELAASRVGELTPAEIEAHLENRFDLLRTDRADAPSRQRSFHAALAWSYDLLPEPERLLLRRLSVFAGPFTSTAAASVCATDRIGGDGVDAVIGRLAKRSMLLRQVEDGEIRHRMHESVRHFALGALAPGEERDVRLSHARWCAALVAQADAGPAGPEQAAAQAMLATVRSELRASLAWTAEHEPDLGLAVAAGLTRFWIAHGELDEGRACLHRALATGTPGAGDRARAHWGSGLIACLLGDFAAVGPAVEEGLALAQSAGDGLVLARLLSLVGVTRIFTDPPGAIDVLGEAIQLARSHQDIATLVESLAMQGFAWALSGDLDAAASALEECLACGEGLEGQSLVMGLVGLGHVRLHQGDTDGARKCLDEGLALARREENFIWAALALAYLADLECTLGHHGAARLVAGEGVEVARRTGATPVIGLGLAMAGNVELAAGAPARSVPLYEEALALCASGERGGVRSRALVGCGRARLELDDPAGALALLEEAVALAEEHRNGVAGGAAQYELGHHAASRNDHNVALDRYRMALAARSRASHRLALPGSIEAVAAETACTGDVTRAARLVAAAEALRAETGLDRTPDDQANYDTVTALAAEALEPDARHAAFSWDGPLTIEGLVAYACAGPRPAQPQT